MPKIKSSIYLSDEDQKHISTIKRSGIAQNTAQAIRVSLAMVAKKLLGK